MRRWLPPGPSPLRKPLTLTTWPSSASNSWPRLGRRQRSAPVRSGLPPEGTPSDRGPAPALGSQPGVAQPTGIGAAMTLQGAVTGDASGSLTAFFRSYESLLAEERRLRSLAEERARAYAGVLAEVGRLLDPHAMDRRRRVDPSFPVSLDPAQWQVLFQEIVERRPAYRIDAGAPARPATQLGPLLTIGSMGQDEEVASLREQVFRLTEALRLAQAGAPASASGSSRAANRANSGSTGAGGTGTVSPEHNGRQSAASRPRPGNRSRVRKSSYPTCL